MLMTSLGSQRKATLLPLARFAQGFVLLLLSALVLTAPLSRDEHMYLAAGVLVKTQRLYADFAYFQMP